MKNNELVKKIKEPISLSYIDEEKGFQLNVQSTKEIFEHISPAFILVKRIEIEEGSGVFEVYVNNEFLEKDYN